MTGLGCRLSSWTQVASATGTRYGLSRGLLGLEYERINISDSDSDSLV